MPYVTRADGYRIRSFRKNGKIRSALEHIEVAERVLGKPLPPGAKVHHADGNRKNNHPSNLVICPSEAYHQLLHKRMRALEACGNADWRKCIVCGSYDEPDNMRPHRSAVTIQYRHAACTARLAKEARRRKQNEPGNLAA